MLQNFMANGLDRRKLLLGAVSRELLIFVVWRAKLCVEGNIISLCAANAAALLKL